MAQQYLAQMMVQNDDTDDLLTDPDDDDIKPVPVWQIRSFCVNWIGKIIKLNSVSSPNSVPKIDESYHQVKLDIIKVTALKNKRVDIAILDTGAAGLGSMVVWKHDLTVPVATPLKNRENDIINMNVMDIVMVLRDKDSHDIVGIVYGALDGTMMESVDMLLNPYHLRMYDCQVHDIDYNLGGRQEITKGDFSFLLLFEAKEGKMYFEHRKLRSKELVVVQNGNDTEVKSHLPIITLISKNMNTAKKLSV